MIVTIGLYGIGMPLFRDLKDAIPPSEGDIYSPLENLDFRVTSRRWTSCLGGCLVRCIAIDKATEATVERLIARGWQMLE